jgi:hypothetical protein
LPHLRAGEKVAHAQNQIARVMASSPIKIIRDQDVDLVVRQARANPRDCVAALNSF